ncbi:MAG: anti-anti-sigma factor [Deltaproteobacteria bacterium CG11_big_fil_rev_8_21_14_0_20_47_16]|nr:MAG: anti-anti-sigma factor [Deltaproteobacteria bacterium CG11_big_fil_rev_8_21_14_0_20_47_16]
MEIKPEKNGEIVVLKCKGSLDAESVASFKKSTQKMVDEGSRYFVIDATALNFVDSMGLGAIISLMRRVQADRGEIKLASLSPDIRMIFELTRLHRVFDICATVSDACKKFSI